MTKIEEIKDPSFLKEMDEKQLEQLAKEIREFLIESISKTGGHLSSNLGVVELTIALHYCFDCPKDKFLFDVGHQSYIHKILTGRAKDFNKLRQYNGLSGFQNRNESEYDCFEAGHSSTALSVGLGMAVGRDLKNEDYNIISIVGDGSMSSGLSLEALNQIGDLDSKIIIVFNDNNMSISRNVGALSNAFTKLRSSKSYINFKENIKESFKNDKKIYNLLKKIKDYIKSKLIKDGIFGEFGIDYLGPVNGHDIAELIKVFNAAKEKDGPVVVHVVTKKGKGYKYAEEDDNGKWHGIGKFNIETGKTLENMPLNYEKYSRIVADHVEQLMDKNKDIVAITPAMITGSCLENIFKKYPDRSFDCGIAEDHAVDFACGLALEGKRPFVSIYSSFLQRAYDQLNHDVCRMNLPIVFGIDRASIVGEDGSSHQGVFDISFLRSLPNMIIASGKDSNEIKNLLNLAFETKKPFVIRYPRGSIFNEEYKKEKIRVGTYEKVVNNDIRRPTIITYGNDVVKIQEDIKNKKLPYNLINARFIKPIDEKMLLEVGKKSKAIFVYTNDMIQGGLGDSILELFNEYNINVPVHVLGINDIYVNQGDVKTIKKHLKLDLDYLYKYIKENA